MLKGFLFICFVMGFSLIPTVVSAQYFDYHREESPAVSWNGVILFDARMLGVGGISLMASPAFAASINPALIPANESIFVGASYEVMEHEAFQYWGVNQGVLYAADSLSVRNYQPSGLTFTFPLKGLRFAAGWYVSNMLELPPFYYEQQYWAYSGRFPGTENTFFAAAAFNFGKIIDIGVKLDVVAGKRDVDLNETYKGYPADIQHRENHRLFYLAPAVGFVIRVSPAWTLGASLSRPIPGKARRTMDRFFKSSTETIEISDLKSTDTLNRPTRFCLGTTFAPFSTHSDPGKKILTLAVEMVYTSWSNYEYEFYSEVLPRNMRNTLVLALGMELGLFDLFKTDSDWFFRLGYRLDPQPITEPEMSLKGLTGGIGMRVGGVYLDVGAIYTTGSYMEFSQKHWIVNGTVQLRLGGN
jgi:hypothetical protein